MPEDYRLAAIAHDAFRASFPEGARQPGAFSENLSINHKRAWAAAAEAILVDAGVPELEEKIETLEGLLADD